MNYGHSFSQYSVLPFLVELTTLNHSLGFRLGDRDGSDDMFVKIHNNNKQKLHTV